MAAPVVHFEILGLDGERLKSFYQKLFDWKINSDNPMNYGLVEKANENSIGGGIGIPQQGMPPMLTIYVEVADVAAHLKKVEDFGGQTLVPETTIPDMVTFGLFKDPEGNVVGLVRSEQT